MATVAAGPARLAPLAVPSGRRQNLVLPSPRSLRSRRPARGSLRSPLAHPAVSLARGSLSLPARSSGGAPAGRAARLTAHSVDRSLIRRRSLRSRRPARGSLRSPLAPSEASLRSASRLPLDGRDRRLRRQSLPVSRERRKTVLLASLRSAVRAATSELPLDGQRFRLRAQPLSVSREQHRLPDVVQLQHRHQQALAAEPPAGVRRHTVPEHLRVVLEGLGL